MKCIIYCRVSSKEQVEGTSLEVQEAACRDFANSKEVTVLRVFVEQGESAKFADRTQLLELLEFCRINKGSLEVLLVWKVDRFARNVTDHYSIKATLAKYGVRIVSVTEPIDGNPEGKLMETILAGFAEFDNSIRAVRTVQGMRRKLQEGIFPWGPPAGYKSCVASGEKKTLPDAPDETNFGLLQRAWKEFATGAHTQAEIGRIMQSWGLVTAHGLAFGRQSLYQLFTNPYYAGILVDPWSKQEHTGKHVPMVTREEFAQVQRVIASRNRSLPHRKEHPEFALRGVIRCDCCQRYMTGSLSRGRSRRYAYYHCQSKPCPKYGKSTPAADAHGQYTELLGSLVVKDEMHKLITDSILAAAGRRIDVAGFHPRRRDNTSNLNREMDELIRMRARGLITDQEFLRQKRIIDNQVQAIEVKRLDVKNLEEVRNQLGHILAPLGQLRETWVSLNPSLRRRFDKVLLPTGFLNGRIGTAQVGLIFTLISASQPSVSSVVPLTCEKWNQIIHEIHELREIFRASGQSNEVLPIAV